MWRIGDGKSVNSFSNNWIPSMKSLVEQLSPWENESTVSGLIKDGGWDEDLIHSRFNSYVAGEILNIPLQRVVTEDVQFWLFDSKSIKKWWNKTPFVCTMKMPYKASTMEFCFWMQSHLSKSEFEEFAIHSWAIWKKKMNFTHGDRAKPLIEQISWSSSFLSNFREACASKSLSDVSNRRGLEKVWKPSDLGCLKLNVDASVNTNSNKFSVGGVVHDNQGRLLLAFGKQINQPISVVHGELLAIQDGLNLLYEHNFINVHVVSNSLLSVQTVTAEQEHLGYEGICVKDIGQRLKQLVASKFYHVSRSANRVAHVIASFASFSPSPFIWLNGAFPSWIEVLTFG
ncbi:uncharacterized protein [Henckelia pumila]|uniref:uncharacterized protein n=1 Tax=Henckelia pumila TaxID=405737 RepID=UPI003C6E5A5A